MREGKGDLRKGKRMKGKELTVCFFVQDVNIEHEMVNRGYAVYNEELPSKEPKDVSKVCFINAL